jgi:hypothetical protein
MKKRPQLLQILFWCILAFHVFINVNAFIEFGFGVDANNYVSWHAYMCLLYTFLWLLACLNYSIGSFAYIGLSLLQFLISTFSKTESTKLAFGSTLFPIDLIFCLILFVDIFSKIQLKKSNN